MMLKRILILIAALLLGTLLQSAGSHGAAEASSFPVSRLATEAGGSPLLMDVQARRFGGRGRIMAPRVMRPARVWRPRRAFVIGPGFRPVRPWWRPGTAVVAGAALGFIAAGTALAWAGQPPGPGYCWYYTDPSQRAGFWDICPP